MQQVNTTSRFLLLTFLFSISCFTPTIYALTGRQVVGATLFTTMLAAYWRLKTKKSKPVRQYPIDDSFEERAFFVIDEILIGQSKKDKKATKVVINPENPHEALIVYEGQDAWGVAGTLDAYLKPVILPMLTFIVLFNKDLKKKILEAIVESREFINNPFKFADEIVTVATADLATAHEIANSSKK